MMNEKLLRRLYCLSLFTLSMLCWGHWETWMAAIWLLVACIISSSPRIEHALHQKSQKREEDEQAMFLLANKTALVIVGLPCFLYPISWGVGVTLILEGLINDD